MKTSYMESLVKNEKFKKLQTGDLVKFEADLHPIIFHYGIIQRVNDELFIYHNQMSFLNKNGGSLVRENFEKYAKGRKIISIEKTNIDSESLSQIADLLKDKKYHFVNNNCEHFANTVRLKKFISPTAKKLAIALVIGLTAIVIIRKK